MKTTNCIINVCKARAAGLASTTFHRKAGAFETKRSVLLEKIRKTEYRKDY